MSGTVYEHLSQGGCEEFHVLLDDGRVLNVRVGDEGIVMDVFDRKPEYADQDEHLGTAAMTFDEWADWAVVDEETTDVDRKTQ